MENQKARTALLLAFFCLSVHSSSVSFVIMQSYEYGIDSGSAGILTTLLEGAQLALALLLAPFVSIWGHKRLVIMAFSATFLGALAMPLSQSFVVPEVFFVVTGGSITLAKIALYACSRLLAHNLGDQIAIVNRMEAMSTLGMVAAMALFGYFALDNDWDIRQAYLPGAALNLAILIYLWRSPLPESPQTNAFGLRKQYRGPAILLAGPGEMLRILGYSLVILLFISLFMLNLIEVYIGRWLPKFNQEVLQISDMLSMELRVILLGSLAIGRFMASYWASYLSSTKTLATLLSVMLLCIGAFALLTKDYAATGTAETWAQMPDFMFLIVFMLIITSPVAPTIIAIVLWFTEARRLATIAGFIISANIISLYINRPLSEYFLGNFSMNIVLAFVSMPITLLLTVLILFLYDLKRSEAH